MCEDEDIFSRCDLDDYLCDLNALEIMNMVYKSDPMMDAVWSAHRWFDSNGVTDRNISGPMEAGANPYSSPWVSSHFKTFRKRLLNGVRDENFRGRDGNYYRRIGDQALMLPALQNARKLFYVPIPFYAYYCPMRSETFHTDDAISQRIEGEYLRSRGYIE
jgi:hypothetical protein